MSTETRTANVKENLEEYIQASIAGDQTAFEELYHYSYHTVSAECYKVLHNSVDMDDAVQNSYMKIYLKLDTLKDPKHFLNWCRTIAHNQSVSLILSQKSKVAVNELRPPLSDEEYLGMDQLDSEDYDAIPEEKAEQEMVQEYLNTALDSLPADRLLCLAMKQSGYTYEQIAAETAMPVGTVKSAVHYAKQQLARVIDRYERKSGTKLHAFTLVPVAGHVEARLTDPDSGWIRASSAKIGSSETKNWDSIQKKLPGGSAGAAAGLFGTTLRKVFAILLSAIVVTVGVVSAVMQSNKGHDHAGPKITASKAVDNNGQAERGNSPTGRRQGTSPNGNANQGGNNATPGTPNPQTPQSSAAPQQTTAPQTTQGMTYQTVRRQDSLYNG